MDYVIRKAILTDAEQLGYVHYNAWIETYKGKINDHYLNELSVSRSITMFKRIRCKNHFVLVVNNNIVGFIGYSKARDIDLSNDCAEIQGIYILKKYQRNGFGKKLVTKAIYDMKLKGFNKVILWVLDSNVNAINFYINYGFVFDGKSKEEILHTPIKELRYIYSFSA